MTTLVRPDVRWHESWAATVRDFGETAMHGSGRWLVGRPEPTESGCAQFVQTLLAHETPSRESAQVANTAYWIADGDDEEPGEVIGFLHLRHELNDFLREEAGHIGYSVRPARRREGHAGRALALGVRRAADLGIDRVLVTCDLDNDASRRTIERNGGVLEDIRGIKQRYWIAAG
jgi:predicted acetyltransferase